MVLELPPHESITLHPNIITRLQKIMRWLPSTTKAFTNQLKLFSSSIGSESSLSFQKVELFFSLKSLTPKDLVLCVIKTLFLLDLSSLCSNFTVVNGIFYAFKEKSITMKILSCSCLRSFDTIAQSKSFLFADSLPI